MPRQQIDRLPTDAPIMIAWNEFIDTPMGSMAIGMPWKEAMAGRIWIAFQAGWTAAGKPVTPPQHDS